MLKVGGNQCKGRRETDRYKRVVWSSLLYKRYKASTSKEVESCSIDQILSLVVQIV